jgi:hypothetical protein
MSLDPSKLGDIERDFKSSLKNVNNESMKQSIEYNETKIRSFVAGLFFAEVYTQGQNINNATASFFPLDVFSGTAILERDVMYQTSLFYLGGVFGSLFQSKDKRGLLSIVALFIFIFGYIFIATTDLSYTIYTVIHYIIDFSKGFFALGLIHNSYYSTWDAFSGPAFYLLMGWLTFDISLNSYQSAWKATIIFMIPTIWYYMSHVVYLDDHHMDEDKEDVEDIDIITNIAINKISKYTILEISPLLVFQMMFYMPFVYIESHMAQSGCSPYDIEYVSFISALTLMAGGVLTSSLYKKVENEKLQNKNNVFFLSFIFFNCILLILSYGLLMNASNIACDILRTYFGSFILMFVLGSIYTWEVRKFKSNMIIIGFTGFIAQYLSQWIVSSYTTTLTRDTHNIWMIMMILASIFTFLTFGIEFLHFYWKKNMKVSTIYKNYNG